MMLFAWGVLGGVILAALSTRSLRRRHRDAVTAAYCNGFRDGVNYEVKVQAEQGKRAVMRTVLSMN